MQRTTIQSQPLLFIVGLQKSGTTLLNRLLMEQAHVFTAPFKLEGRQFWGDDPPFTPTAEPCGLLYQKHQGRRGHTLKAEDFNQHDQHTLQQRLAKVEPAAPVIMNKNPYNTVRIGWLKTMFPQARIVAIVRQPMANVFSLLKKHIPHQHRGLGPEEGWWGVKPDGWQAVSQGNLIRQIAHQYRLVNQQLLDHLEQVDLLIDYAGLCADPSAVVGRITGWFGYQPEAAIEAIPSRDHEYRTGGRLLSLNRQRSDDADVCRIDDAEVPKQLPGLNGWQRFNIHWLTRSVWQQAQHHIRQGK